MYLIEPSDYRTIISDLRTGGAGGREGGREGGTGGWGWGGWDGGRDDCYAYSNRYVQ